MSADNCAEHFVTLFDSNFLPMGVALHGSLMEHCPTFHLWIVCMDRLAEEQLGRLSLPQVTLIPLESVETEELLAVKPGRSRGEYCWTLTPFTFQAVFDRDSGVERVTYLDADLFFFANPQLLLDELDAAKKQVLITEHAFAPEHEASAVLNGRFCVQFLTFRKNAAAMKVMHWWQARCLEWCFARPEEGKFGDQKYLDLWPEIFENEVHIVSQTEKTLAPWNVQHVSRVLQGRLEPVFFHFHQFRIIASDKVRPFEFYDIGEHGLLLYDAYLVAIRKSLALLGALGMPIPYLAESRASRIWRWLKREPNVTLAV